ncbi:MAG: ATP-binding protein [Candidatus Aminicenantaceae bacterium]
MHILDIVENSIAAKAKKVEITITEDLKQDLFLIEIKDNGIGMDNNSLNRVLDPFYTTKTTRQFGLGLPLLSEAAKAANGKLIINSNKKKGTIINAQFQHSHIDRKPIGNMSDTLLSLVIGNPEIDFVYIHKKNGNKYTFDTKKIKTLLKGKSINSPEGIRTIREILKKEKKLIGG